jgi:hypothetical protein
MSDFVLRWETINVWFVSISPLEILLVVCVYCFSQEERDYTE